MNLVWGVLLSLSLLCACANGAWQGNPVANPKAIVTSGNVRFTVLTPQLIRMEYSPVASFRDSATLAFLNRNLPVPPFTTQNINGGTIIKTGSLVLSYSGTGAFDSNNLNVSLQLNGNTVTWNMGSQPTGNLLGTIRTLDDINGGTSLYCPSMSPDDEYTNHCTLGVLSRDGWAIYDDSESATWDNDPKWPWFQPPATSGSCNVSYNNRIDCNPGDGNQQDCEKKGCCYAPDLKLGVPWCFFSGPAETTYQDIYFFGYGHNYVQALQDFTSLSGPIPTFPRYIFGPQYSRWHAYNEVDEVTIVEEYYEGLGIPLDVLVLDMDWHYTYNRGGPPCNPNVNGWTGYTWDRTLFPNPARFLTWAHSRGLHITNNMHPAAGVQCSEQYYPEFATSMGVDPNSNATVAYAIQNKTYSTNFFEIVLKPLSNQGAANGIDYWWIDYQQGESTVAPGINPTFWVNYVFSTAASWWGASTRPLIMARWGGLGNHRMSTIGFSGDVTTSWDSLAFQPYFTSTASNVGFFWSHDLGGFAGQPDPELYVRWIQWGLFSNLLRTHCYGKQIGGGDTRDIWEYPAYYFNIMRDAFILRSRLVPYIYTQHALSYNTGVGLLRPMYYAYPEDDEAYHFPTQYMFGDTFIVSPVLAPNPGNNLTEVSLWLPSGVWIEYNSGKVFTGPISVNRSYTLFEIPAFVPSGAIIPMRSDIDRPAIGSAQQIPQILRIDAFPYQSTQTTAAVMVEDDGVSTSYEAGSNVTTTFNLQTTAETVTVTIGAAVGPGFAGQATQRAYQINLVGAWPATSVQFNGASIPYIESPPDNYFASSFWTYDPSTLTVSLSIPTPTPTTQTSTAKFSFENSNLDPLLGSGFPRKLQRLQACKDLLDDEWGTYYPSDYPTLLIAAGTGLNSNVSTIYENVQNFDSLVQTAITELNALSATQEKNICLGYLQTA
jgi:alpha-glucosidase (family GH31 glycosyl hydrolase)